MTTHADTEVYVGAGNHELLRILWTGFQDGLAYCRSQPAGAARVEPDQVVAAAKIACECKLQLVEPLDRAAFHPAYTYGWMTGYLAAHLGRDDAVDGLSPLDPAILVEYAHQAGTEPLMH